MGKSGRLIFLRRLPYAVLQAFFMVIELPKDLGPYSQMSSLSMFMHRAFPMRETNDTAFEYKFDHILILACVMVVMMMGWPTTRSEVQKKHDKSAAKAKKTGGQSKKSKS